MLDCWMISNKLLRFLTYMRTVSGWITKRHAAQVDVWISIGSYDIKEASERVAWVLANCSCAATTSFWMADKKLDNKSWYPEESIEERTTYNTSPISTQESHHRWKSWAFSFPIPIDRITSNTEINCIKIKMYMNL